MDTIAPELANLAWQVTHNDPSPFNMVMTGRRVGFIDFGDGCRSPRFQDLAIAAGHMVTDPSLPLAGPNTSSRAILRSSHSRGRKRGSSSA